MKVSFSGDYQDRNLLYLVKIYIKLITKVSRTKNIYKTTRTSNSVGKKTGKNVNRNFKEYITQMVHTQRNDI